jgi:hypothetical protein
MLDLLSSPAQPMHAATPPRAQHGMQPLSPMQVLSPTPARSTVPAGADPWALSAQDCAKYDGHFFKLDTAQVGFLSGAQAAELLSKSKLPKETLSKIWNMSDADRDGRLSRAEFRVAMHLAMRVAHGSPLPPALPPVLAQVLSGAYATGPPQPIMPQPSMLMPQQPPPMLAQQQQQPQPMLAQQQPQPMLAQQQLARQQQQQQQQQMMMMAQGQGMAQQPGANFGGGAQGAFGGVGFAMGPQSMMTMNAQQQAQMLQQQRQLAAQQQQQQQASATPGNGAFSSFGKLQ